MRYDEIIEEAEKDLKQIVFFLEKDLAEIRTARPSTSIIEDLEVDCFGKKVPIKGLGMISINAKREIIIQPFDSSYLESIEKAVRSANLGLSPMINGKIVRIPFPSLTKERREAHTKQSQERD